MISRMIRSRSQTLSSDSSSSSAPASPANIATLNFTLYGAPAPRSLHRTSISSNKVKPKRRSTKPTPPPPASPISNSCSGNGNPHDFRLDLSSLTAEDELTITCNGTEVFYEEDQVIVNNHRSATNETHGMSKATGNCKKIMTYSNQKTSCKEINQNEELSNIECNKNIKYRQDSLKFSDNKCRPNDGKELNSSNGSSRSFGSDKDLISQTCSELESSSQGFIDALQENETESTKSTGNMSDSSSYITLSEYSINSFSSNSSVNKSLSYSKQTNAEGKSCINNSNTIHRYVNSASIKEIKHFQRAKYCEDGKNILVTKRKSGVLKNKTTPNPCEQHLRRVHYTNFAPKIENVKGKKIFPQSSSGVVSSCSTDVESQTKTVSPKVSTSDYITTEKSNKEEVYEQSDCWSFDNDPTVKKKTNETLIDQCNQANNNENDLSIQKHHDDFGDGYSTNNEITDRSESISYSPELYGYYSYSNGHETPSEEWTIEEETTTDEQCFCCTGKLKPHACSLNGFKLQYEEKELLNQFALNSCIFTSSNSSLKNNSSCEKISDGFILSTGLKISPETTSVNEDLGTDCIISDLNRQQVSKHSMSPPNFKSTKRANREDQSSKMKESRDKSEIKRRVCSAPIPIPILSPSHLGSSSVLTCSCESERKTRLLLEQVESSPYSDFSAPDIPLSAEEIMELVLHARQLVCVLEHALDRAVSLNTNRKSSELSMRVPSRNTSAKIVNKNQRSNSLSPNILRRCKGTNSNCKPASADQSYNRGDDSILEAENEALMKDTILEGGVPIHDFSGSEKKDSLPCKIFSCYRKYHEKSDCYRSRVLNLSPEQLKKQRSLLKPVNDREIHKEYTKVFDLTDILKNALAHRRKFVDPLDEYICKTNRSVSEWSLEDTTEK